ncbi:MAG: hypothetical protein OXK72_01200 [Gammaproteobacteria bacterium]|nr:hypothetical protein [Gammaproteobacteria bacterium]
MPFRDGDCSVRLEYESRSVTAQLEFSKDWNVSLDPRLLQELREISEVLGINVVYKKPEINA